jgi:cobalt-zinc-cadmium efflux system membrane fusion protein
MPLPEQTMTPNPSRHSNVPRCAWLWLLPLFSLPAPGHAQQPLGCLIEPDYVAEVGSQVVGVIESLQVERGQRVAKGQVIALLRADVERAAVGVAKSRSDAVADIQAANANAIFGKQRQDRARDLLAQKFISDQAYDQIKTEADVAAQKLAQAQEQRRLAQRELELANSQLAMRTVRSPVNGIIVERYMAVGERIEEKPMVRIAVVDPLRVQVVAPSSLYGRISLNTSISITPELPNAAPASARVILIDKMLDSASNTFRVTLTLPNPGHTLPAGLRCRADFGADAGAKAAAKMPPRLLNGKLDTALPVIAPAAPAAGAKPSK